MRKYPIVEIKDVQEHFCGIYRKNTVPLSEAFPEIAEEWLYSKNAGWGPEDLSRASGVRAWWECRFCNREYKAQICNRTTSGTGCPYCASKKVCSDNALTVFFPKIAAEWHPTKNKKLKVIDVTKASSKRVWWQCSTCNHAWNCAVADRTTLDSGCPACYETRMEYARLHPSTHQTPKRVLNAESTQSHWYTKPSSENFVSLYEFSKSLARQWHPIKNGKITANQIAKGSDAIAWWKCPKGPDHEWQSEVFSRTKRKKALCPFCTNLKFSVTNSLQVKAPDLVKELHPTKNGKLRADKIIAGGNLKVWWRCKKDNSHEWEAKINARIRGTKCPDCTHQRVSKDNCLNNEFSYIAAQLHPTKNADLNGNTISIGSSRKVWWTCPKGPDHEWQATPANRIMLGSGCPACTGRQISVTNCLATLKPDVAKLWHPKKNGKLTPTMVSPHSKKVVWWLCEAGHYWEQSIQKRTASKVTCWTCRGKNPPGMPAKKRYETTSIKVPDQQKEAARGKKPIAAITRRERSSAKSRGQL